MNIIFENENFKWIDLENPTYEELSKIAIAYQFENFIKDENSKPEHLPKFINTDTINFLLIRFFYKEHRSFNNTIREFSTKLNIFFNDRFIITYHQKKSKTIKDFINNYKFSNSSNIKDIIYYLISSSISTFEKPALEMDNEIDKYEDIVFTKGAEHFDLKNLYNLKKEASACKKILTYLDQALNSIINLNDKNLRIKRLKETNLGLINLHTQIVEDSQNLLNIYLSLNSQKANDIMKTLTLFSAYFLPLTFIAGIYGMNFRVMPELNYKWAYPICLSVMALIVISIFLWFKKKKFL